MPWLFWCPCGGEVSPGGKAPAGGGQCLKCERVFANPDELAAAGGGSAHLCGGRGRRAQRCQVDGCALESVALCDEPVGGKGGTTCDRRVCARHRVRVGRNRDRCPEHARQQQLGLEAPGGGGGQK